MTGFESKREAAADKWQEPVAWRWGIKKLNGGYEWRYTLNKTQRDAIPLYTTPPQREWVGLANEDWNSTPYDTEFRAGAEWAGAKLKERNHGT